MQDQPSSREFSGLEWQTLIPVGAARTLPETECLDPIDGNGTP